MKLLYKTRGDSSPQGKQRVYFTGHPNDFKPYFDEIIEDILEIQDCAIYYDAEPDASYDPDELLHELEQMQLFVIPVTSNFLFKSNRALDVEFHFAMEHHIPVLPLMQESGLEPAFNQKCGDLQLLNKHDQDITALPFEEKLKKYLNTVLVGDELAEKVRAAFDAYVFLSYRKKDRQYAQELMRLIHKNEFCRDIALWYDEFLIPGENFNEAIDAALKKCSLFALTVTPSVIEKDNYVMTVEYPEAYKAGKKIIPAELVSTDKETLSACYQDLPPCTDAHDEKALSDALLKAVQGIALRSNDAYPEHNFFIGLAYLNGIDVEVDRKRALSLIKSAADNELLEAMEKLVGMYRNGEGVERDYLEAIRWQERLTEYWKNQFDKSGKEEDGLELAYALCNLGDYHKELEQLLEAKNAYKEMYRISKSLVELYESTKAKSYQSVSYSELGDIYQSEGRLSEAKEFFLLAIEIEKVLCAESQSINAEIRLAQSYQSLGDTYLMENQRTEAENYFQQALNSLTRLSEIESTLIIKKCLFTSYNSLGNFYQEDGRIDLARESYLKAEQICRKLCQETRQTQYELTTLLNNLGDISLKSYLYYLEQDNVTLQNKELEQAKDYYTHSINISKQLYEQLNTMMSKRNLSESYFRLGVLLQTTNKNKQAYDCYVQAGKLRAELYKDFANSEDLDYLAMTSLNVALMSEEEQQRSLYSQAYDIWNHLSEKYPDQPRFLHMKEMVKEQLDLLEDSN